MYDYFLPKKFLLFLYTITMSTSVSTSAGGKIYLPATDVVEGWNTKELIDFSRKQGLNLIEDDFEAIRKNRVTGASFLSLTMKILIQNQVPSNYHMGQHKTL